MSSTEFNIGLTQEKSSSRVLRPPGGASSNIFAPAQESRPHVRPKYDQQNSSNLNFCMNTVDPNVKVQEQFAPAPVAESAPVAAAPVDEPQAPRDLNKMNGHVQESAKQCDASLPANHHHRSTALW